MKLNCKDYPFIILVEDKLSQNTGKLYQALSVGYTSIKNRDATDAKEKYKTDFINFFDERDLLKLAELCQNTYKKIRDLREHGKKDEVEEKPQNNEVFLEKSFTEDDDIPFN